MASKKKSARPAAVKSARPVTVVAGTLETPYPFQLKAAQYRVVFRNGLSVVYDGAALAANPHVPVAEIVRVYDSSTGELVFEVPKEEEAKPEPGFYVTQ